MVCKNIFVLVIFAFAVDALELNKCGTLAFFLVDIFRKHGLIYKIENKIYFSDRLNLLMWRMNHRFDFFFIIPRC